jgi:hypothetical protein
MPRTSIGEVGKASSVQDYASGFAPLKSEAVSKMMRTRTMTVLVALAVVVAADCVTFGVPSCLGGLKAKGRQDPTLFSIPSSDWQKANVLSTGVENGTITIMESSDGGTHWRRASAEIASAGSGAWDALGSIFGMDNGYLPNASAGPWTSSKRHSYSVAQGSIVMTTDVTAHSTWSKTPGKIPLLSL